MRAWVVLLGLVHSIVIHHGVEGKRFDPAMVDPLMRRSSLDKNFMRFGRSSPSYTEEDDVQDSHDASPGVEASKEETFLRSMRGKDNFIRFGRDKNGNFMRFGRGKQDNFMRFGKSRNGNFMRFGRGKQDNFMRFGRGKQDNYMRFGRGKPDNFMRFGRGKQDNFIRFGRGNHGNFMRFGRGKQDSYMRFGRDNEFSTNDLPGIFKGKNSESDLSRDARGKEDNYMRFGKRLTNPDDYIPIAMRSGSSKENSNFIRFGRAKQDSFMRFGKSDGETSLKSIEDSDDKTKDNLSLLDPLNDFTRDIKSKDSNMIRFGRHPPTKDDGFIRFGRNSQSKSEDSSSSADLIPQRLKRSVFDSYGPQYDVYPSKTHEELDDHVLGPLSLLPDDLEEEYDSSGFLEDYTNRKKRSLKYESSTPLPSTGEDTSVDFISAKVMFDSSDKPHYHSTLLSAGLPNVIVGPEFSLLPDLDPPTSMLKRGRPGDQNFMRLG